MTPQHEPRTHSGATLRSLTRRDMAQMGMAAVTIASIIAIVVIVFFPNPSLPATADDISRTYGVEVLHIDKSSTPNLVTVRTPGNETLTCLRPSRQEREDREPLRNCTPAPDATTIPAR